MSIQSPLSSPGVLVAQDLRLVHDGQEVLRGADLTIAPGETVAVVGAGADAVAARMLCRVVAGLALPASGWIHRGTHDLTRLSDARRSALRRRDIGVALDDGVIPDLPVLENLSLPLLLDGWSHRRAVSHAADLVGQVGLDGLGARRPADLAPREHALVGLARALVTAPHLVVAEDPSSRLGLSPADSADVLGILAAHCTRIGAALLLATEHLGTAELCDRRLEVRDSRLHRLAQVHYAPQALL